MKGTHQSEGTRSKMKFLKAAIVIGVGAATAAGWSLLKVSQEIVIGSTTVVIGPGLMVSLRNEDDLNKKISNYKYFFNKA